MPRKKIHEDRDAYKNQWTKENRDRVELIWEKGQKLKVGQAAKEVGQSLNAYVTQAVFERMERDIEKEII